MHVLEALALVFVVAFMVHGYMKNKYEYEERGRKADERARERNNGDS